jgi:hypothetical protein
MPSLTLPCRRTFLKRAYGSVNGIPGFTSVLW